MTPDEIKSILRDKGMCGEIEYERNGIPCACILTCEQHHDEVMRMRPIVEAARRIEKAFSRSKGQGVPPQPVVWNGSDPLDAYELFELLHKALEDLKR